MDEPPSNFAFKLNLRRYTVAAAFPAGVAFTSFTVEAWFKAGADTRPLLSSP
jgi:hypothetical protein